MERSVKAWLYNRCDFERPLPDGDPLYEPIDQPEDGGIGPRGDSCSERIVDAIAFGKDRPRVFFFSGLPGSGKSTELGRLAGQLTAEQGCFTALVDMEPLLELSAELDLPDLLLAMLFGAEARVLELERSRSVAPPTVGPLERIWRWFEGLGVTLQSVDLNAAGKAGIPGVGEVSAGVKATLLLRNDPKLRDRFRDLAAQRFSQLVDDVATELKALEGRVRACSGHERLVLILDSLEKVRGTSMTWQGVLGSAERVFRRLDEPLRLPVHVVVTVPPAVVRRLNLPTLHFLPMIKLWDRERRAPFPPGFAAVERIIRRRIPDVYLEELLGSSAFEARRRQLIAWSAGYPRELVRLLGAIVLTRDPVRHFDQVLGQAMNNLMEQLSTIESVQVVAQIIRTKRLEVAAELEPMLDRLISNNVILRYQNRELWYDVHPCLHQHSSVVDALTRLEQGAPGAAS